MKQLILLLTIISVLAACKNQDKTDRELILEYISTNNLDSLAQEGEEGLFYIVEQEGNGTAPSINNTVEVHYEGFLLDGSKFDSSIDRGDPAIFPLANVIRGWQLGIPKFKPGGRGKLIIPSSLAYGRNPPPTSIIPSNAVLVFTVELISVQ